MPIGWAWIFTWYWRMVRRCEISICACVKRISMLKPLSPHLWQRAWPAFPKKSVIGSYYVTRFAARRLKRLVQRTKSREADVSASNLIELGIRLLPKDLDTGTYQALVARVRAEELALEAAGVYGQPFVQDTWAEIRGERNEPRAGPDYAATLAPTYFNYRKTSIYAGSNEIQHNIMAKMVLGL